MFWDPTEYTVLDWRALHCLVNYEESAAGRAFDEQTGSWWDRHYEIYRLGCQVIAKREHRELRDVDRALWRWSCET
jgi:hypothetical protein